MENGEIERRNIGKLKSPDSVTVAVVALVVQILYHIAQE